MENIIPGKVKKSFIEWSESVPDRCQDLMRELAFDIQKKFERFPKSSDYHAPAELIENSFERVFSRFPIPEKSLLQRALISRLALEVPSRIKLEGLPQDLLAYYPSAFERMEATIRSNANDNFFPHTRYARLVLVATIPLGAESLDLKSSIPITSAVLSIPRMRDVRPLLKYFSCKGWGVWFRSHLDTEYLDEFNKEGLDQYYLRVAKLLVDRVDVRGLVSTSWFRDPVILSVSPRLSHLIQDPVNRGAFLIKHRSTEFDVQQATKTSPTRRRLYEQNKYIPTSYSVVWPREKIISWYRSLTSN